jgi:type I restriction enzyme M protein
MDDEEEKTVKAVKTYLKSQIDDLEDVGKKEALEKAKKLEKVLTLIKDKESKLKDTKRALKGKERELEVKIENKKKLFTEAQARELILQKFFDGIHYQLERYLSAEEKKIVSVLGHRWDKYQVPLSVIESDRDKSAKKLFKFLSELGYKK